MDCVPSLQEGNVLPEQSKCFQGNQSFLGIQNDIVTQEQQLRDLEALEAGPEWR